MSRRLMTRPQVSIEWLDRWGSAVLFWLGVTAVFVAAIVARTFTVASVFRNGAVVMLGNDPYTYWTQVGELVSSSKGVLDVGAYASFQARDPLFVSTLGWIAELFGGTPEAVAHVLAVYPLVAALVTVGLVSVATYLFVRDRWAALVAGGVLAVVPAHAFRSTVGYADHHAFDQVWIALSLVALVYLVRTPHQERTNRLWLGGLVLGAAVAAQILAWKGGVLYALPVGIAIVVLAVAETRTDDPAPGVGLSVFGGLVLAAGIVFAAHASWGWHDSATALVPAFLALGVLLSLVGIRTAGQYTNRPSLAAIAGVGLLAGFVAAVLTMSPSIGGLLAEGVSFFSKPGAAAEGLPLLGGPRFWLSGPYQLLGLLPMIGLPYLIWATFRTIRSVDVAWVVVLSYTWYFLAWALYQQRFTAEFAVPFAIVVGLGLVDLAGRLEVIRGASPFGHQRVPLDLALRPDEDASRAGASLFAVVLVLLVLVSAVQIGAATATLEIDEPAYEGAQWTRAHAEAEGLEYPENYVLSDWNRNRMFNYFVNGHGRSFSYALGTYDEFVRSRDEGRWYAEFRDKPVGYVVTRNGKEGMPPATLYARLHRQAGSDTSDADGLGRFRLLYAADNGSIKVFRPVEGAVLTGRSTPDGTVRIQTDVDPAGTAQPVTYERRVSVSSVGWYAVRVPYDGEYRTGNGTVTVSETAVGEGRFVSDRRPSAHWSFDAEGTDIAFDRVGGNHGWIRSGRKAPGIVGRGLALDGDETYVVVPNTTRIDGQGGFTLSLWVRTDPDREYREVNKWSRLVSNANVGTYQNTTGYQLGMARGRSVGALGDGPGAAFLRGPHIDDGRWHHVALAWNGTSVRLYVDGEPVDVARYRGEVASRETLYFGRTASDTARFPGMIDEVKFRSGTSTNVSREFDAGRNRCLDRYGPDACPTPRGRTGG